MVAEADKIVAEVKSVSSHWDVWKLNTALRIYAAAGRKLPQVCSKLSSWEIKLTDDDNLDKVFAVAELNKFQECISPGYSKAKDKILLTFINNPDAFDNEDPNRMVKDYAKLTELMVDNEMNVSNFPQEFEKNFKSRIEHLFDDTLKV